MQVIHFVRYTRNAVVAYTSNYVHAVICFRSENHHTQRYNYFFDIVRVADDRNVCAHNDSNRFAIESKTDFATYKKKKTHKFRHCHAQYYYYYYGRANIIYSIIIYTARYFVSKAVEYTRTGGTDCFSLSKLLRARIRIIILYYHNKTENLRYRSNDEIIRISRTRCYTQYTRPSEEDTTYVYNTNNT